MLRIASEKVHRLLTTNCVPENTTSKSLAQRTFGDFTVDICLPWEWLSTCKSVLYLAKGITGPSTIESTVSPHSELSGGDTLPEWLRTHTSLL